MKRSRVTEAIDLERWATTTAEDTLANPHRSPPEHLVRTLEDAADAWQAAGDETRAEDLHAEASRILSSVTTEEALMRAVADRLEAWAIRLADFVKRRSRPTYAPRVPEHLRGALVPTENTIQEVIAALESAEFLFSTLEDFTRAEGARRLARAILAGKGAGRPRKA